MVYYLSMLKYLWWWWWWGVHIWSVYMFRSFTDNVAAQLWYFTKCIYFVLSCYQIRSGYPTRIIGNVLTKNYNYFNLVLFKGSVSPVSVSVSSLFLQQDVDDMSTNYAQFLFVAIIIIFGSQCSFIIIIIFGSQFSFIIIIIFGSQFSFIIIIIFGSQCSFIIIIIFGSQFSFIINIIFGSQCSFIKCSFLSWS